MQRRSLSALSKAAFLDYVESRRRRCEEQSSSRKAHSKIQVFGGEESVLATTFASPVFAEQAQGHKQRQELGFGAKLVTALTVAAVLIHGYHPYAEDGGVYVPEIKRLIDPALYPRGAEFVVGHLQYSLFAPMIAGLVRVSHVSLDVVLFAAYLASFWVVLLAAWMLAERCFEGRPARCGAVSLLAVWMTLPIAGTSLMLMDPYVTARSFSTPCALLALVCALDWRLPVEAAGGRSGTMGPRCGLLLCAAALLATTAMHPLMGGFAVGTVLMLVAVTSSDNAARTWFPSGLAFAALALAAGCVLAAPQESDAYRQVVATRTYWFLSRWHWYELVGIVAPLLLLGLAGAKRWGTATSAPLEALARTAVASGAIATAVAVIFARSSMQTHLVARLQPLRTFQLVYIVMILMLGGALGERLLRRKPWRWVATFLALGMVMVETGRATFPASAHIEWPEAFARSTVGRLFGRQTNSWQEAFVWIRENTPRDAVFALDPHYITASGEDAQSFRAVAERSALPDYSKDGGVVTNEPGLASEWIQGQTAQRELEGEDDAHRLAALVPLGVGWVVLQKSTTTGFNCMYENRAVKVCRLP